MAISVLSTVDGGEVNAASISWSHDVAGTDRVLVVLVAFDNTGNFTAKLKSLIKKYNLNEYNSSTHITSDTFKNFCHSVYLNAEQSSITVNTIPVPSFVYELLQQQYLRDEKQDDEKFLRTVERYCIRNKDKITNLLRDSIV